MIEMQCYCEGEAHFVTDKDGGDHQVSACGNTIPYKNHHDWGRDEDFMCEDCLNNCGDN
jgi:hypothetical protein